MALTFTTEQEVPFSFEMVDGRGRPVAIDGVPAAVSSDDTVVGCELEAAADGDGVWHGRLTSVAASPPDTTQRVVITADAAPGEEVLEVIVLIEDITVTLDPRTVARMIAVKIGQPVDEAV